MKKIYLFCNAGMSTSILATNMQEEADRRKLPILVDAIPFSEMGEVMEQDCPDIILLGPQIKYMHKELCTTYEEYQKPIAVIDTMDYGMMDGSSVLDKALALEEKGCERS